LAAGDKEQAAGDRGAESRRDGVWAMAGPWSDLGSPLAADNSEKDLWIGNCAEAGRLPPKGFPKDNRFEG
jgi:topoisomerase-4 subunit A